MKAGWWRTTAYLPALSLSFKKAEVFEGFFFNEELVWRVLKYFFDKNVYLWAYLSLCGDSCWRYICVTWSNSSTGKCSNRSMRFSLDFRCVYYFPPNWAWKVKMCLVGEDIPARYSFFCLMVWSLPDLVDWNLMPGLPRWPGSPSPLASGSIAVSFLLGVLAWSLNLLCLPAEGGKEVGGHAEGTHWDAVAMPCRVMCSLRA